ncbi:MAG: hypothetical protein ACK5KL_08740 [Dysgonomonas sp.]
MKKYIIVAVVAILIPLVCLYLKRQHLCILEKDEKKILYLMSLVRDDNKPQVGANEFYLQFTTYRKSRSQGYDMSDNYIMHVIPQGDSYCTKILLMSSTLYDKGENVGHAHPTGEWSDCGNAFMDVLNYYFKHKSKIKVIPKRMNPNN